MNLQQFLSQESLDTLLHQFFSIEGQSQKSRQQESTLISSIVLSIASSTKTTFAQFYQELQYQLEVNNQEREAVKKMCRLMVGVMGKASYLLKNVEIGLFVDEVLQFFLDKVFVTVCSADCVRCIWALINAYNQSNKVQDGAGDLSVKGGCSSNQGCGSSDGSKGCCSPLNKISSCCKSSDSQGGSLSSSSIANHEKICKSLISKFLGDFKLHVKTYPFKVRKDIYKLLNYLLKFVQWSQQQLLQTIAGKKVQNANNQQQEIISKPLLVQIGMSKHQLIQLVVKCLCDEKDPRNMTLIFQDYLLLISQFPEEISTFNYRVQIFQNIEGYYPLSMEGDQGDFKVEPDDAFSEAELRELLDECLLNPLFISEVREMLVEKMLAPPIHQYTSLYVKFITKFNPSTYSYPKTVDLQEQIQKYSVLTMNLLHRLCQQEYLEENYDSSCNDGGCTDSGCGSSKNKSSCNDNFSIAELISAIIKNVFISPSLTHSPITNLYEVYTRSCEQKYLEFLNSLIVHKLFNHEDNNKHAGTIIDIVKTILNPHQRVSVQSKSARQVQKAHQHPKESEGSCCGGGSEQKNDDGGCCGGGGGGGGGGCGSSSNACGSSSPKPSQSALTPTPVSPTKLLYGHKLSYQQILTTFITFKFMQYWSAKGDVAFKLGLLIIALNKKLQNISIDYFLDLSALNESTQNTLQHLLITLGNVYETHKSAEQIKIMVLKTLMIMASMFGKLYSTHETQEKNINKIRKINNSIVHKDCIKFSLLLRESSSQMSEENDFSRSQSHILKSYADYLMELYVNNQYGSESIIKESEQMLENIFGSFSKDNVFENMGKIDTKVAYLDVKLYAAVRYLSILGSKQGENVNTKKLLTQPIKLILSMLFSSNSETTNKLLALLRYYTYPVVVSLTGIIFRHISLMFEIFPLNNQDSLQSLFINISLMGKIVAQKLQEWHTVEMELGYNYGRLIISDVQKCFESQHINSESKTVNRLTKILMWYMFRKVWRRESPESLEISFGDLEAKNDQSKEEQFTEKIYASVKVRISLWMELYSKKPLNQLTLSNHEAIHDLQCSLLYVKYLNANNSETTIRFNKKLAELYDPGMIEYFWNRLLNCMTYQQKSIISPEAKQELIQLIEHLPQKILVLNAQHIAPIVIYDTVVEKGQMVEESKEILQTKDRFDYGRTELIGKLSQNLPQASLITYVLPYCLNFLKIAALACQKNTSFPSQFIPSSESIQALLNINKIVNVLLEKSQQKQSQKLRKSVTQTHKKEFNMFLSRLIYHKKRVIRQSSRNLLMSFE